jgi:hypothetical protein
MYLKNLGKPPKENTGIMVMFTKPWFVIGIVIVCFAILTPKIFLPLFRQITGIGKTNDPVNQNDFNNMPPHLRMRNSRIPPRESLETDRDYSRPGVGPQFGRAGPGPSHSTHQSGSSSKSILTFLLPVYAVGIGLYMVYTLFKVFNKDEKKEKEESDYEDNQPVTYKFRERNNMDSNFVWDANEGEFKFKSNHFQRSEESEDEANNYERYKDLDPDYVEYLKERRRAQRAEKRKMTALASKTATQITKDTDIPLTSNIGLTSITNTNVLMNDTLERMKYQLNKINNELHDIEKRGNPFEDPEIESLRLQLSQTELQMAKIMSIVSTVSSTVTGKKGDLASSDLDDDNEYNRNGDEFNDDDSNQMAEEDDEIMINEYELLKIHQQQQQQKQQIENLGPSTARRRRKKKNKNKSNNNQINGNHVELDDEAKRCPSSSLSSSSASIHNNSDSSLAYNISKPMNGKTVSQPSSKQQLSNQTYNNNGTNNNIINSNNQNQSSKSKKKKSKKKNK